MAVLQGRHYAIFATAVGAALLPLLVLTGPLSTRGLFSLSLQAGGPSPPCLPTQVARHPEEVPGLQTSAWKQYFMHFATVCIVAPPDSPCPRGLVSDLLVFGSIGLVVAPTSCKGMLEAEPWLTKDTFANGYLTYKDYAPDAPATQYADCEALIFVLPKGPFSVVPSETSREFLKHTLVAPPSVSYVMLVPFGWSFADSHADEVTPAAAQAVGAAIDQFLVCHAEWQVLHEPLVPLQPPPHVWFLLRHRLHETSTGEAISADLDRFHRMQKAAMCPLAPGQEALPACSQRKFIVFSAPGSGFASVVRTAGWYSLAALQYNRTLIIKRKSDYTYADQTACPDNDLSCTFVPRESECNDWVHEQLKVDTPDEVQWKDLHEGNSYEETQQFWIVTTGTTKAKVFEGFHGIGYQYMDYLTTPHYATRRAVGERIAAQKLSQRYMSMHVRHGDKISEMELMPFSSYMRYAKQYAEVSGTTAIYIATDNQTLLNTAAQIYPSFDFHYLQFTRIGDKAGAAHFIAPEELLRRGQMFIDLWTDLTVATNSDFFLGSSKSGFTSLVVEKRFAASGEQIPGVMLGGGKLLVWNAMGLRRSIWVNPNRFA